MCSSVELSKLFILTWNLGLSYLCLNLFILTLNLGLTYSDAGLDKQGFLTTACINLRSEHSEL